MEEENDVIIDVNKKRKKKREKILSIVFLIWFIASIVAMLVLAEINSLYTVIIFGQYFLIFGFVPIKNGEGKEKLVGVPFLLVGICCIFIPLFILHPELLRKQINWDMVIPILGVLVFIFAGIAMLVLPAMEKRRRKKVYTEKVEATIVRYETMSHKGTVLYCPVYRIKYWGREREISDNSYSNFGNMEIGTELELKINPNNPEEFIRDNNIQLNFIQLLGMIFLAATIPILIFIINGTISF